MPTSPTTKSTLIFVSATAPANLASRPVAFTIIDEIDKFNPPVEWVAFPEPPTADSIRAYAHATQLLGKDWVSFGPPSERDGTTAQFLCSLLLDPGDGEKWVNCALYDITEYKLSAWHPGHDLNHE